jgi:hypothetical protein
MGIYKHEGHHVEDIVYRKIFRMMAIATTSNSMFNFPVDTCILELTETDDRDHAHSDYAAFLLGQVLLLGHIVNHL